MRFNVRRSGVWVDAMVIAAIVAVGTVVAGVTNAPAPDVEAIPGCDDVVPAQEGFSFTIGSYGGTYDNPDYPWLTAAKATAMSDALVASFPADVDIEFAAPSDSLIFQPMNIYPGDGEVADGITVEDISGDSAASGVVNRGEIEGPLRVSVEAWDGEIPPCTEGRVDERTTLPDGTVVDTLDAVSEYDGESTHRRTAIAYFEDTIVSARTSNDGADAALPLGVDELRRIVSHPELRVSAEVPDGTPPARRDCGSARENPVPPLSRQEIERLGASLRQQWAISFPGVPTDRAIGDLLPGSYGSGSACDRVDVTTPAGPTMLTIDISLSENTGWSDTATSESPGVSRTTAPDGTVVMRWSDEFAGNDRPSEYLRVLRPSNTVVQIGFGDGIDIDSLVELASGPGLDL